MRNYINLVLASALLVGGFDSIAQGKFQLDPGHTLIEFNVKRFMVGEVTGKFKSFDGVVTINQETNELKSASLTIQTQSLDTDHEVRDGHLKGEIWLDTQKFEEITFTSERVWKEGDTWYVGGKLMIKGITNDVQFPFEMQGPFKDPTGTLTIGLKGDLTLDRQDYGIKFSRLMDNGELFIGNEVKIRIRALAALQK